jgi:hypothetical protein
MLGGFRNGFRQKPAFPIASARSFFLSILQVRHTIRTFRSAAEPDFRV